MVEARQAELEATRSPEISKVEGERLRRREGLLLSRSRVVHELDAARDQRHRELLERSLRFLDAELGALEAPATPPADPA